MVFLTNFCFSQEKAATDTIKSVKNILKEKGHKLNRFSFNVGTGVSIGTRPYTKDYFVSTNNKLFNDFKLNSFTIGGQYMLSKFLGVKSNITFDHFINNTKNKSKPFEMAQYRVSFLGTINLSALAKPNNLSTKFNLYLQTGILFGKLQPIAADYNPKTSNGEIYGAIVLGVSPSYRFSKRSSIFIDYTSLNTYGQNITWNGKHASGSDNVVGNMYAVIFGISYELVKQ